MKTETNQITGGANMARRSFLRYAGTGGPAHDFVQQGAVGHGVVRHRCSGDPQRRRGGLPTVPGGGAEALDRRILAYLYQ